MEHPSLYMRPTVFTFPEKALNEILFFIVNVGYKDVKTGKGHTLAYLTPAQ